ncbi:MAG: MOSC N-terminal beta barrel domain-containing protein [Bacteroidota bacterium]
MQTISEIYVYPIKSMGAIALKSAVVTETGFAFDRYWMLVDAHGNCLTQRQFPMMALFQLAFADGGIQVSFQGESIIISNSSPTSDIVECHIWEDIVGGIKEPNEISDWFSGHLKHQVFLVRMAPNSIRHVKRHTPSRVHFPDSSPYLVIGKASLELLNEKLDSQIPIDRFRPNLVFSGGTPHDEDDWQRISIGTSDFEGTKLCARCTVTTIDQKTGQMGEEPLIGLSKYRRINRKIMFGHYFKSVADLGGTIAIGDKIDILQRKSAI